MEDCTDRYYTKVIKTLLKSSFNDRQLVLVNTARALKFLEFILLKKATSKKIENLQEAQLDRQIQTHCLYPHPQSDAVQINALEYDSDIDGQTELLPDIQPSASSHTACTDEASSHAENIEDTAQVTANSKEHPTFSQDSHRLEPQSQPVLYSTEHSVYQDTEHPTEEYPNNYRPQLEDIPELEDDEENWEEGQFANVDFIDHHNNTEESDQIHHEYSVHFVKVTDQGYSSQNNRMPGFEYYIPKPEY